MLLGKEICFHLVSLGASLLFLNRNEKKSLELINEIHEKYPEAKIEFLKVDMQDFNSVKQVTEELKTKNIDVLMLNAGAYKIPRNKTSLGFDNVFQINFISPYYMVRELLPVLNKKDCARVVVVGSIAHNYSKINENDIDFSREQKPSKVYGNAKRFLMYSLYELFKFEKNVKLSICHPGITYTNITSHYPKLINMIIKYPMKIIFMSPKKASLNMIKSIFADTQYHTWIGPRIFNVWGYPRKINLYTTTSVESNKIGEIAENIYNNIKN